MVYLLGAEREAMYARQQAVLSAWEMDGSIVVPRAQMSALSIEQSFSNLHMISRNTPVFNDRGDIEPIDIIPPQMVQVIGQSGYWKRILSWQGEKWIYTEWLPESVLLEVPNFNQLAFNMPTGCEIVAVAMMINHEVEVDVLVVVDEMPRSFDPLLGFRGDPFDRGGFTILPPALLELTERHLGSAKDMTGSTIEEVQMQLVMGRPVVVWVRGMWGFTVHALTLTGFNDYGFFYNDPWGGGKNEFMAYAPFIAMWEDPIWDRHLLRYYPPRMALSY